MIKITKLYFLLVILTAVGCSSNSNRLDKLPRLELSTNEKLNRANQAYESAQLDRAETLYYQVIQEKPRLQEAWLRLGNVYLRQNRLEASIRCFEETIKLDPEDGRAWYNLALARVNQATNILETAEQSVQQDSEYRLRIQQLRERLLTRVKGK